MAWQKASEIGCELGTGEEKLGRTQKLADQLSWSKSVVLVQ